MLSSRIVAVAALLFAFAQATAFAQSAETLLSRSDFTQEQKEAVREVLERADALSVPRELLIPRLAEGLAKGAPARRVVAVLATDLDRFARARELLRQAADGGALLNTTGAWSRTATLLAAEVPESVLRQIAAAAAFAPAAYRPASELYVSLTDWGLESGVAADLTAAAVRSQLEPSEFPALVDILTQARRNRMDPERVADEIIRVLPGSSSLRSLRQRLGL